MKQTTTTRSYTSAWYSGLGLPNHPSTNTPNTLPTSALFLPRPSFKNITQPNILIGIAQCKYKKVTQWHKMTHFSGTLWGHLLPLTCKPILKIPEMCIYNLLKFTLTVPTTLLCTLHLTKPINWNIPPLLDINVIQHTDNMVQFKVTFAQDQFKFTLVQDNTLQLISQFVELLLHHLDAPAILYTDDTTYKWLHLGSKAWVYHFNKDPKWILEENNTSFSINANSTNLLTVKPISSSFAITDTWMGINWNSTHIDADPTLQLTFLKGFVTIIKTLVTNDLQLLYYDIGALSSYFHYTRYTPPTLSDLTPTLSFIEALKKLPNPSFTQEVDPHSFWPIYLTHINTHFGLNLNTAQPPTTNLIMEGVSPSLKLELQLLSNWSQYWQNKIKNSTKVSPKVSANIGGYEYSLLFKSGLTLSMNWVNIGHFIPKPTDKPLNVYDVNSLYPYVMGIGDIPQGIPKIVTDPNLINKIIGVPISWNDFRDKNKVGTHEGDGFNWYTQLKDFLFHLINLTPEMGFGWAHITFKTKPKIPYTSGHLLQYKWYSITELRYLKTLDTEIHIETLFIYPDRVNFSNPVYNLSALKIAGNIVTPPFIQNGLKILSKRLLNSFWGKSLSSSTPLFNLPPRLPLNRPFEPFELQWTEEGVYNIGWKMKHVDLALLAYFPNYKVGSQSFTFITEEFVAQSIDHCDTTLSSHGDPKNKNVDSQNLEMRMFELSELTLNLLNRTNQYMRGINGIFLPECFSLPSYTADTWPFPGNFGSSLKTQLDTHAHTSELLPYLKDFYGNTLINFLNNMNNPYYAPEIGLETLSRARIYMHTLAQEIQQMGHLIVKIDTDAIFISGSLPDSLISTHNLGWLKKVSGPHKDWFFGGLLNTGYYGDRFYFPGFPSGPSNYYVAKGLYSEPNVLLNKQIISKEKNLTNFSPTEFYNSVIKTQTNHLVWNPVEFPAKHLVVTNDMYGWLGLYLDPYPWESIQLNQLHFIEGVKKIMENPHYIQYSNTWRTQPFYLNEAIKAHALIRTKMQLCK